ncbi:MAG TPA: family 16 glycoside hydrolase [Saprospiraceae bacterium]|nr:family 16 glycoside hydrolase [Saprospiraceae bacterium]
MKKSLQILVSVILLLIAIGCKKSTALSDGDRPYQPWVFRSVLDQQPRIITLALHDNVWAAYHTDSCSLYQVWKGNVKLQGAVYDNAHGPQPITIGNVWMKNPYGQPWKVTNAGQELLKEVQYAGHSIKNGHAQLMYKLICTDGTVIHVSEQPEFVKQQDGQMGFERKFNIQNDAKGYEVSIAQRVSSIALKQNVSTNGKWNIDKEDITQDDARQLLTLDGRLILNNESETYFTTLFISHPTIINPNSAGEDVSTMSLGERLIDKNDCKTCHNKNVQTIGPSFKQIAERYPQNDETVATLTNKVIKGGAGIWGSQVMSAHPELPVSDAEQIIRYVLALDTTDAGQKSPGGNTIALVTEMKDGKDLLPGLLVEAYTNQKGYENIPSFPATKKADQAGIISDFMAIDAQKFGGLNEDFILVAKGYLYAENDTTTGLRIWSDDGSKVTIDGKLILDNDGQHGTEVKEAIVKLSRGYHPITLEYMQGKGGRYLSFEWKPDGATEWTGVPSFALLHSTDVNAKLQGKTLSMAIGSLIPGDMSSEVSVHPSYDLTQARPWDFLPKVGGMDFMSDGTLVVSTWDPSGSVYLLSNVTSGDPAQIKVKRIASGLAEPLGLKVIRDTIYIMQKQELTRLVDTDGDGMIDEYQCVSNNWQTSGNFHEFSFGLAEKDGDLYATLATDILPGGASAPNQPQSRGHAVKFDLPSGELSYIASGLRTPNGIGLGIDNEIFVADNQGDWLPSSKILHVTKDAWFGSRSVDFLGTASLKEKLPVVWLPQDEIGNSPSTPLAINDGPYKGQMIHGEVTHGGIKRVFVEKINGEYQGVVFRFTQGLEAGINRMVWGPDGALYVGGIGNPGNWQQSDKLWYGLQRLKYNSKPTFEMLAVRAKTDGVEIEFTEPLKEGDGWNVNDWEVKQWRYVPTANYGGPKVDNSSLKVLGAYVSADRKKVSLKLEGMKPAHVVYIHMKNSFISDSGLPLWSTEAWYTMNQIPQANPVTVSTVPVFSMNTLTPAEASSGWKLLFDGKTTNGWHNFNKSTIGASWVINDNALMLDAKKNPNGDWQAMDGGDILTSDEFENFELNLEWKIAPCGNSGIIYNVVESTEHEYVWQTGPEMQVLDNTCHPDARFKSHKAGDLYDFIESTFVTVKPAGQWNKVRIIKNKGHVEHWLNGRKVVEYDMYTDKWNDMISKSKFKDMKGFGLASKGKISLQDHGNQVWYRNIKIKSL